MTQAKRNSSGPAESYERRKVVSATVSTNRKKAWRVEFNTETCSICEMCVHRCPNDALFILRVDSTEEILFDYRLCTGCRGEVYCQTHCPEDSVTVSRVPLQGLSDKPVSLISGQMAACQDCGSYFMPVRKLATLLDQQKITPLSAHQYCPSCRRNHLFDSYLKITSET